MNESSDRRAVWLGRIGVLILRLLAFTWRVRFANPGVLDAEHARGQRVIYLLWHGQLLPLLWTHRGRSVGVPISEHRDGEIIAAVARSLGFRPVRGSTFRGATRALLGACRELEAGHDVAVTVDGPRGPAGSVAPGALIIAQRTGAPMIPVGAAVSRAWHLRSWDRFTVPKPFARIIVWYGEALRVDAKSPREAAEDVNRVRLALDRAMDGAGAAS